MQNQEEKHTTRFITKERFDKAKESGNYGEIYADAKSVIDEANDSDVLELKLVEGSAFKVVSAIKVDEQRFLKLLRN